MSGQSRQDAISFVDDEDDELALNEEEEIDVQGHGILFLIYFPRLQLTPYR
jgi:hypothetical protein